MQRAYVLLVSLLLTNGAAALDGQTRPVSPVLDWNAASLERFDDSWLHLKFIEGSSVELVAAPTASGQRFTSADGSDLSDVNTVLAGAVTMRRTFPGDREKFQAFKARGEAASGQPGPDLSLWYDVKLVHNRATLADTINALNALSEIEIAHPAPISELAVVISPPPVSQLAGAWPAMTGGTPDFTDLQDYLYDTPVGLDAPSAWAVAGGRGAGIKYIDVEQGWVDGHEDFDQEKHFYHDGPNSRGDHGTAVMGEVVGMDNGFGITGFASEAQWGTVGYLIAEWPELPHRFLEAAEALDPGDIWLIEIQMFPPGRGATPMEWVQVNYDVIWTSSWALDVVCVEAGANGAQDLDAEFWDGVFDRDVRDSGAILVGAGTPIGRSAESFTNYGSRMDVNAWGSQIVTTGYGDLFNGGSRETEYTRGFGGTSGASPMVVGSGLCLQGIALANLGKALTPVDLRALLHDTGIEHLGSRMIGPRPDLAAAIEQLLKPVALRITLPDGVPSMIPPGVETEVLVRIREGDEELDVNSPRVHYRFARNDPFAEDALEPLGGEDYLATIPAGQCGEILDFYVSARSIQGTLVTNPVNAPDAFHTAIIAVDFTPLADDFEDDLGWTVVNEDLQDGAWERAIPFGPGGGAPPSDYDESGQCYVTGNRLFQDIDGGPTRLISPTMDLIDGHYTIQFARWFIGGESDRLDVELSNDDGNTWTLVESFVTDPGGWDEFDFDPAEFAELTDSMRVRFSAADNPNNSFTEAGLDAFLVEGTGCIDPGEAILPESFEITRGAPAGGDLEDLFESDNSYVRITARLPTELAASSVEIELTATTGTDSPGALHFTVEAAASGAPARQRIELYDYDSKEWELVDEREAPAVDTRVGVIIGEDAARFIQDGTGEMKARIGYQDLGITFPSWGGRFDQAFWTIVE